MTAAKAKTSKKVPIPKLFKRGKKGTYYFRIRLADKDKWISTRTENIEEARTFAEATVKAQIAGDSLLKTEKQARKVARQISESMVVGITGKKNDKIKLADAHNKWIKLTTEFNDLSERTRKFYCTIFRKFVERCQREQIEFIEQVDREMAMKYAKSLWDGKITGKTYNDHLKHLSKVFSKLDAVYNLPCRDPFDRRNIPRLKSSMMDTQSHEALEPKQMEKVINEAANHGQDYLDLFIIGSQTGMRLKDAALLDWSEAQEDFIEITPEKTSRSGNKARIPVSAVLRAMLDRRKKNKAQSKYVIPGIAEHYLRNPHYVTKRSKDIFEKALGRDKTNIAAGKHRRNETNIISFHSFRVTFMSLLASKDVSTRDAMRIMGWESMEMIKVYERELEKARGDADTRALKLISNIDELNYSVPPVPDAVHENKLSAEKADLEKLIAKYSNISIGRIYDVSEAAVRKWLDKYGLVRGKRIESADLSEKEIGALRKELKGK